MIPVRILITGSRDWDNKGVISDALLPYEEDSTFVPTLVSGACKTGADVIAENIAEKWGWVVERHPANWNKYGKKAGMIRNDEMVKLGADICFAFIKDGSLGASMTANRALKAYIPLVIHPIHTTVSIRSSRFRPDSEKEACD